MQSFLLHLIVPVLAQFTAATGLHVESDNNKLLSRSVPGGKCFAKTNTSAGTICGQAGSFHGLKYNRDKLSNVQKASLDECRDYCFTLNNPEGKPSTTYIPCRLFTYNTSTTPGKCILWGNELNHSDFDSIHGGQVKFYSTKCFECDRKCPIPKTEGNLLNNPGFDKSDFLVGPWSVGQGLRGGLEVVPGGGETGSNALRVRSQWRIAQQLGLCSDQDYLWSMRYKLVPQNSSTICRSNGLVRFGDGNFVINPAYGENTWLTGMRSARVGNIAQVELSGQKNPECSILVDYMSVKPIDPPQTLKTTGKSLIRNGGFETGKVEPWTVSSLGAKNYTFKVTKSGLGSSGGSYRYQFDCTDAKYHPSYSYKLAVIHLKQKTLQATEIGQTYVITLDYLLSPDANFFSVAVDHVGLQRGNFLWEIETSDIVSKKVVTFSRIFSGTGRPLTVEISAARAIPVHSQEDPFSLILNVDNVSIRKLVK